MAELDRDELLSALSQLNDNDDANAADAGRRATALLFAAGLDWSDVIVASPAITALDEPVAVANGPKTEVEKAANIEDALILIERLLARDTLYEGTRDDLLAYKEDIAEGTFDDSDLGYLNALYARVMSGGVESGD